MLNNYIDLLIEKDCLFDNFTGKKLNKDNIEIYYILDKENDFYIKNICKKYNCSKKTAKSLLNTPLLNVLITDKNDKYFKKTDDIIYIDCNMINLLKKCFEDNHYDYSLEEISIFRIFKQNIKTLNNYIACHINWNNETDIKSCTERIKEFQFYLKSEINIR